MIWDGQKRVSPKYLLLKRLNVPTDSANNFEVGAYYENISVFRHCSDIYCSNILEIAAHWCVLVATWLIEILARFLLIYTGFTRDKSQQHTKQKCYWALVIQIKLI